MAAPDRLPRGASAENARWPEDDLATPCSNQVQLVNLIDPQLTSRTNAEGFRCPRCEAKPGERCTGARGKPRETCHRERHERATNLFDLCGGSWELAREMER